MNRRDFLQRSTAMTTAARCISFGGALAGRRMGIIVHSYAHRWNSAVESKAYPPFRSALDLMEHCAAVGAGGIQVMVKGWTNDFAKKVRDRREDLDLYLEGSISLPANQADQDRFESEVRAAREAGASIVRTVCLSGRRYETFHSREEFRHFKESSLASLALAEPIVRKHRIKLAVENHKDWRAAELAQIMKKFDSEWMGVNLDFGNNIALLEEPIEVVETLLPWLMTTHVKDMSVEEYADGFLLSEVPLGNGFLDLSRIFSLCKKQYPDVHFNLEMITRDPLKIPCLTDHYWSTFTEVPPEELARSLRMVRHHKSETHLPKISHLTGEQRLAVEEDNILKSLRHSRSALGLE